MKPKAARRAWWAKQRNEATEILNWSDADVRRLNERTNVLVNQGIDRSTASWKAYLEIKGERRRAGVRG